MTYMYLKIHLAVGNNRECEIIVILVNLHDSSRIALAKSNCRTGSHLALGRTGDVRLLQFDLFHTICCESALQSQIELKVKADSQKINRVHDLSLS